jgi:hypothetical protein
MALLRLISGGQGFRKISILISFFAPFGSFPRTLNDGSSDGYLDWLSKTCRGVQKGDPMAFAVPRAGNFNVIARAWVYLDQCLQEEQRRRDSCLAKTKRTLSIRDHCDSSTVACLKSRCELNFDIFPWPKRRTRFTFSSWRQLTRPSLSRSPPQSTPSRVNRAQLLRFGEQPDGLSLLLGVYSFNVGSTNEPN